MLPQVEIDISVDSMQTAERIEKGVETSSIQEEEEEEAAMTVTPEVAQHRHPSPITPLLPTPLDFKIKPELDSSDAEDLESIPEKNSFKSELSKLHDQNPNESVRSWLQRISAMQQEIQRKQRLAQGITPSLQESSKPTPKPPGFGTVPPSPPSRVVNYQDLPYMGEMTLDNSKPRRGRKPKKADICHLIYKNYGTIFPGTPKNLVEEPNQKKIPKTSKELQRTNVQNRIISSLLEKRLTQESLKKVQEQSVKVQEIKSVSVKGDNVKSAQDEPLNLCIRDLNQLKIRLLRKHGNFYASDSQIPSVKSEVSSDDDVEIIEDVPSPVSSVKIPESSPSELDGSSPVLDQNDPNLVYWPNPGILQSLQSHLMYYQKLANGVPEEPPSPSQELRKLVPKVPKTPTEKEEDPHENRLKRNATPSNGPTKKKRSAIFIPPIPQENQNNPATEVSICKFKFTGGAKPSLQEKKMLSVDSGGNFRYYSGTGDKSMRGYEFFPRETLQQAGSSNSSATGAFLQATGEKIPLPSPENKPDTFLFNQNSSLQTSPSLQEVSDRRNRKRKTRKSIQREKLEQTFKEKGFLIQTQQLESAEGATYCKFRQLRKFTRYLFRSWKDYLPGNVQEMQENEQNTRSSEDSERLSPEELSKLNELLN